MAPVNIVKVLSVNSEDPVHTAQNLLLKDNPSKKWKSKAPGEKQSIVILQLEKATKITGIDIGNEFSAFVEVLVAKSTSNEDDYKVLLVASTLMSFEESKNGTNTNAIKFFNADHLSKPAVNESWDRLKIICTQPFNKHVQYGLSFIIVHSKSADNDEEEKLPNLGKFTWKKAEDDSTFSAGSLFSKKKLLGEPLVGDEDLEDSNRKRLIKGPLTGNNSSEPSTFESSSKPESKKKQGEKASLTVAKNADSESRSSLRGSIVYEDEDSEEPTRSKNRRKQNESSKKLNNDNSMPKAKNGQPSSQSNSRAELNDDSKENFARNNGQPRSDDGSLSPSSSKNLNDSSTRNTLQNKKDDINSLESTSSATSSKKRRKPEKKRKNFYELMNNVVFVISGFENPYRSELRSKALEMGAKYKQDWNASCTHLICAFPNTPKFNQVKGKGKIVQKEWVEACYSKRRRYPWRRFALDKKEKKKPESEDEIFAIPETGESESESESEEEVLQVVRKKKVPNPYDEDTDVDEEVEKPVRNSRDTSVTSKLPLPYLPDFFSNKTFYISSSIRDPSIKAYLLRCIVAYKGKLVTDLAVKIHYVVVNNDYHSDLQSNISLIQESHPDVVIVKQDWIKECSVAGHLVPLEPYSCE